MELESHRIADPAKPPRLLDIASWCAIGGLGLVGIAITVRLGTAVSLYAESDAGAADLSGVVDARHALNRWVGFTVFGTLLAALMFIPWFAMAYANLGRLGVQHRRWRNGWAVGAWFVPVLSLFRPKQIANDIWRGSERGVDFISERWRSGTVSPLVHWWWGLYLLGGAVTYISPAIVRRGYLRLEEAVHFGTAQGPALDHMKNGAAVDIVGCACLIVAAFLGAAFVREATQRLEDAGREAATKPATGPPLVICPECAEYVAAGQACRFCGFETAPG